MVTNKFDTEWALWVAGRMHAAYGEVLEENLKLRNMLTKIRYVCEIQSIKDPSNKLWDETARYIDNPVEEMK